MCINISFGYIYSSPNNVLSLHQLSQLPFIHLQFKSFVLLLTHLQNKLPIVIELGVGKNFSSIRNLIRLVILVLFLSQLYFSTFLDDIWFKNSPLAFNIWCISKNKYLDFIVNSFNLNTNMMSIWVFEIYWLKQISN